MNKLNAALQCFTEVGITPDTKPTDDRYIRFLNTTLLIFVFAQLPIIPLLVSLKLWLPLSTNVATLATCGLGFVLIRTGRPLPAKLIIIGAMTVNTAYFATLLGSTAPIHLWLIAMAVLGVLAFKPSEWAWSGLLIGLTTLCFIYLESVYPEMAPAVHQFNAPEMALQASRGSTIAAMLLTLLLVGMMHRRFILAETALSQEKAKSDQLLRAILPAEIADELRETGATQAVRHEDVGIMFADIVGFTPLAASMPAEDVVALLSRIFACFDTLIEDCQVEKIKTIGDAYMVASGVPHSSPDHAHRLARCACGMLRAMASFSEESGHALQLRIGLHRGPAVAGVIGTTRFAYDLWGESVNLASRLESSGQPGRVHVSDGFRTSMEAVMDFETRGEVDLKGIGPTRTHWLVDVRS